MAIYYVNRVYKNPERTHGLGRVTADTPLEALKKCVVVGEGRTVECVGKKGRSISFSVADSSSGEEQAAYLVLQSSAQPA